MSQITMIAMLEEAEDVLRRAGCDMTADKVRGVLQAQQAECGSCDGFNSGCEECSGLGKDGHLAALRQLANVAHRVAHSMGMPAGFDVTTLPDVVAQRLTAQPPAVAVPDGVARAVETVAGAIYFADSSDYLSALWDTLRFLSPEIAAIAESDTRAAWERAEQDRAMLAAAPQTTAEDSSVVRSAVAVPIHELEAILNDADAHPPTHNSCCEECGRWTPWNHPEAHDHKEGCTAPAEYAKRRDWEARLSALIAAAQKGGAA